MAATVSIPQDDIQVDPGAEKIVPVRVRNNSGVIDQLAIDVIGAVAGWVVVEPAVVRLFPDAEETVDLRFRPPTESAPIAGSHVFGLRVRSREDPTGGVVEERTVVVAPKVSVTAELAPKRSTGRRTGKHRLVVENRGNAPAVVSVSGQDPDGILAVSVSPEVVKLQPGEGYVVKVRPAIAGRRPPNGTPVPFAVYYLADGRPSGMVDGAFVPRSVSLRPLLAIALPVAVVLALVVALVARGGGAETGVTAIADELVLRPVAAVSNLPEVEATERLSQQGFGVRVTRTEAEAEAGTVVGQDPPAGTQLEEGAEVEIIVSLGPEGEGATGQGAEGGANEGEEADGVEVAGGTAGDGSGEGDPVGDGGVDGSAGAGDVPAGSASEGSGSSIGSSGSPTTVGSRVAVPAVAGRSSAEAAFMLSKLGFAVKTIEASSKTVTKSLAISTQPASGSSVTKGSTVVLTVSSGRPNGVGATTDLSATRDGVTCSLQGSTVTISFTLANSGSLVRSAGLMVTASNGFAKEASAIPGKTQVGAQLTVGSADFGKPLMATVVVDHANGVNETDENNNVLAVEVTPPSTTSKVAVKASCRVV